MSNTARPKRQRKAKREGPTLTRAIPHIRLGEANRGKLDALDAVWRVYKPLCERYMAYFCTKSAPDKDAAFVFESELSARWQRVAVQQAAGVAQSWRSNRANRRADYLSLVYCRWLQRSKHPHAERRGLSIAQC